jgi:O-antigen/teichoic acid export membrane protein
MSLKRLAKDTAIYGLSSILGRALYFLLTPFYTYIFENEEYGVQSGVFAFTAIMMVVFTYRMETAYFRYESDAGERRQPYFDTAMLSIIGSTVLLGSLLLIIAPQIASLLSYAGEVPLFRMAILILAFDALSEIPLSRLRLEGRPMRFAFVRLSSIGVNIGLNLFFLAFCPYALQQEAWQWLWPLLDKIYDPDFGIGYIFLSNLIASLVALLLLSPMIFKIKLQFDWAQWKKMLQYSAPLVIVGFSYVINEVLDRAIFPWFYSGTIEESHGQLGIYAANYKLAMLIALFIQAYRYGAEPFFFKQKNAANSRQLYADLAGFFTAVGGIAFLGITLFIDITKYFIPNPEYWPGLKVVPILAMANIFLGIYYNFATWYKLADMTRWGAYISIGGAIITIVLNVWWIPRYSYMGCAWATLICYSSMAAATWWFGRKFYPIPYRVYHILLYLLLAVLVWGLGEIVREVIFPEQLLGRIGVNLLLFCGYLGFIFKMEREQIRLYFGF